MRPGLADIEIEKITGTLVGQRSDDLRRPACFIRVAARARTAEFIEPFQSDLPRPVPGAAPTRPSLRPLIGEGGIFRQNPGNTCRAIAKLCLRMILLFEE
jgi:hypothetical protein